MTSARPLELFQPASVDEARALLAASPPSAPVPDRAPHPRGRTPRRHVHPRLAPPRVGLGARGTPTTRPRSASSPHQGRRSRTTPPGSSTSSACPRTRPPPRPWSPTRPRRCSPRVPTRPASSPPPTRRPTTPRSPASWRRSGRPAGDSSSSAGTTSSSRRPASPPTYPSTLTFEQLTDPADPRLAACHREVMRDTLDAHDAASVARVGFDEGCREALAFLLDSDPVECIHLALDRRG